MEKDSKRNKHRNRVRTLTIGPFLILGSMIPLAAARVIPQDSNTLVAQAVELEKAKDYRGAEKLYRQALAHSPGDPEILKALARQVLRID